MAEIAWILLVSWVTNFSFLKLLHWILFLSKMWVRHPSGCLFRHGKLWNILLTTLLSNSRHVRTFMNDMYYYNCHGMPHILLTTKRIGVMGLNWKSFYSWPRLHFLQSILLIHYIYWALVKYFNDQWLPTGSRNRMLMYQIWLCIFG